MLKIIKNIQYAPKEHGWRDYQDLQGQQINWLKDTCKNRRAKYTRINRYVKKQISTKSWITKSLKSYVNMPEAEYFYYLKQTIIQKMLLKQHQRQFQRYCKDLAETRSLKNKRLSYGETGMGKKQNQRKEIAKVVQEKTWH